MDHATLEVTSKIVGTTEVVGPHAVEQTKRRIVGQFEGFLVRGKK